ncbi:sigma-54-dependent transcriptional regulator [Sulfurivermis fontis]|uniref:sigma-54-dependent transcriptional regulator n=1 Tax=Sulfurivermis fontis TaxID=1972068 RepID=UPI000FDC4A7C|nr:sigma-54 dependent transcriptional regulator [Sulfurivermis fontis]
MADRILIVEDDDTLRLTVGELLTRRGFEVDLAGTAAAALALATVHRYQVALLDLRLPDGDGLEMIGRLQQLDDNGLVVIMTAFPEVRTAVAALKAGAYDYINKPFDLDDLLELVHRAVETQHMRRELAWRRAQGQSCEPEGLIGSSPAFRRMVDIVQRIASAGRVPVLIRGESGTGKERVARSIHCLSPRTEGPWIAINCAALPENLLEAEMFGHEKGAFTDAKQAKQGLLELADGGTLFLDEIGDLSLTLQPKLLRALEAQTFRRLGGNREIQVDVRFVAATNRDLEAMVRAGTFREDLYYRLNVGSIDLPPLRERREDVLPLARHFLVDAGRLMGLHQPSIDPSVEPLLEDYAWPGNIRELRNVIERALILAGNDPIQVPHLPKELTGGIGTVRAGVNVPSVGAMISLEDVEREHIRRVLESCKGNKTHAAKILGITRLTLRHKITEYGFDEFPDRADA